MQVLITLKSGVAAVLVALAMAVTTPVIASDEDAADLAVGKKLYNELCVACHAAGVDGAPRVGMPADWSALLPLGADTLYKAVIEGPDHMYSVAGSAVKSEGEVRAMLGYMLSTVINDGNKAVVNTASADDKALHLQVVRGKKLYNQVCFSCHTTGVEDAPKLGSVEDWKIRRTAGAKALAGTVIHGSEHMYARAGTAVMSAADFESMVAYMLSTVPQE